MIPPVILLFSCIIDELIILIPFGVITFCESSTFLTLCFIDFTIGARYYTLLDIYLDRGEHPIFYVNKSIINLISMNNNKHILYK